MAHSTAKTVFLHVFFFVLWMICAWLHVLVIRIFFTKSQRKDVQVRGELAAREAKAREFYLKYARTEAFRKALVYQKRYLLLLLGGFRESDEETLRLLSVFSPTAQRVPRWRAVALCVRACMRFRFLTRRWDSRRASVQSIELGQLHGQLQTVGFSAQPSKVIEPDYVTLIHTQTYRICM